MSNHFPPPPAQKGTPVLAWLGIGCGSILLLAIVGIALLVVTCKKKYDEFTSNPYKAAAELYVRANPDLETVSHNDAAGELTVRAKDGKEYTLRYEDVAKGNISLRDGEGNRLELGSANLDDLPSWVPRIPGMGSQVTSTSQEQAHERSGLYLTTSDRTADETEAFFEAEAKRLGSTQSRRSSFNANGTETRSLSYSDGTRELTLHLTAAPGAPLSVQVGYKEPR